MARTSYFPQQQRLNPYRRPEWRWQRANDLVRSGQYLSRKRDDLATKIGVEYLRGLDKCVTELRLKRFNERFRHVANAHGIWQGETPHRLEVEMRILARQSDVEISLAMNLPAATIQAYGDLFFHLGDRIDSNSYVMEQIFKWHPTHPPTRFQLVQACVYFHGPHLIEPAMDWLLDEGKDTNLNIPAGRLSASFDLLFSIHSLPECIKNQVKLLKLMPIWSKNQWQFSQSVSAAAAFRRSTTAIVGDFPFPEATLQPYSYAPTGNSPSPRSRRRQYKQAA